MSDADEIARRKRRCTRSALAGVALMALALLVSAAGLVPPILSTIAGAAGLALLAYGVHLGWTVFYDREDDGPPA